METMKARVAKMEAQLEQWAAKLDNLVAQADAAGAEAKAGYRKNLEELKAKQAAARAKLDELRSAGSDTWETVKDGVESTWRDLEIALKKLMK